MKLAIIGTGYVGLVTGSCLAEVGHEVVCLDIDRAKIAGLKRSKLPIYEPGLAEIVLRNQQDGRLHFTDDLKELGDPEAIFLALPTPPKGDGDADLSFVLQAAADIAPLLKRHTVVITKSTVPVGTSERVSAALAAATDVPFDVVSNPEFLREGVAVHDFMEPDRIVAGSSSARARKVIDEIYHPFTAAGVPLLHMDPSSAEMTKYAANTFLATKIAFINEIANICERTGADVEQIRRAIGLDSRIGPQFLHPGLGYGGSCFPKDVLALEKTAALHGYTMRIVQAVIAVNARQRELFIEKILRHWDRDLRKKTIAVWGLAFKPDTDDIREAPSLSVLSALREAGAHIRAYDPEAMPNAKKALGTEGIVYTDDARAALEGADALVIVTEWKEFAAVEPADIAVILKEKIVFDGRNIFDPEAMRAAGITYYGIGRGHAASGPTGK